MVLSSCYIHKYYESIMYHFGNFYFYVYCFIYEIYGFIDTLFFISRISERIRNDDKERSHEYCQKHWKYLFRYSYTSTLHAVDMSLKSKYLYLRTAGERRIKTRLGIMFNRGQRPTVSLSRFTILYRNCIRNVLKEAISRVQVYKRR